MLYLDYSNVSWWLKLEKINSYNLLRKGSHFKWLSKERSCNFLLFQPQIPCLWLIFCEEYTITLYRNVPITYTNESQRVEALCPFTVSFYCMAWFYNMFSEIKVFCFNCLFDQSCHSFCQDLFFILYSRWMKPNVCWATTIWTKCSPQCFYLTSNHEVTCYLLF